MVKKIIRGFVFFLLIVLFVGFASATFTKGNLSSSLTKSYGPGEPITGWINLSLNNEPINSKLTNSISNVSLIDLIKKDSNAGFIYTCNPVSCASDYDVKEGENSKIFNLVENETFLFGFKISASENVETISQFIFNLTSNNPETNKFPLAIDILNDGKDEWRAYSPTNSFGNPDYGCYGESFTTRLPITTSPYCQRIKIGLAPAVSIGAYVVDTKDEIPDVSLRMTIQAVEGGQNAECIANVIGTKIECSPLFPIMKEGYYHVCIRANSDDRRYQINSENVTPCGFSGTFSGKYRYDFEIFEKPKKYAPNINFTLNTAELDNAGSEELNLKTYVKEYLENVYKNNCSNDCIIPVKIYSGIEQQIKIESNNTNNEYILYFAGIPGESKEIYGIDETPAKMNAGFQKLFLEESGFLAPTAYGNATLSLSLGGNSLLSEKIYVEKVPIISYVAPQTTAINYPTTFRVVASSENNITKYSWDFGDGEVKTTTTNFVEHTYAGLGDYPLIITAIDSKNRNSSKQTNISVGPAKEIVPTILEGIQVDITNIKAQILAFSAFEQKSINRVLNISDLEEHIDSLSQSASVATLDEDFDEILAELLEIEVPNSIVQKMTADGVIFYPEKENIDLATLKKIGGGDYVGSENAYKDAVLAWEGENTNIMLLFNDFSLIYKDYERPLKSFEIGVTKLGDNDAYIFIKKMENLLFKEDYNLQETAGYYYFTMSGSEKIIAFSTTENVDFVNLPVFISPSLMKLSVAEWSPYEQGGALKKWVLFTIITIIIILIALIVWIILHMWYKRKYETYLFKDRNHLYNLVSFIELEKRKGTSEKDIAAKLKKAGWNNEQTNYAIKKYVGKRTGMPEIIPIEKILGIFRKKEIPKK